MSTRFDEAALFYSSVVFQVAPTFPSSAIPLAALQDDVISVAKLLGQLKTGFFFLPFELAREIAAADYQNAAANGGLLATDTTPVLQRINVGTDPQTRARWAATNVDALQWAVMSPHDFDPSVALTVKAYGAMSGATDTPTLGVAFWEGVGGTDLGGVTGALSTTPAVVSRNVTATANPKTGTYKPWSIILTPGAHGTNALDLYGGLWIEYRRQG